MDDGGKVVSVVDMVVLNIIITHNNKLGGGGGQTPKLKIETSKIALSGKTACNKALCFQWTCIVDLWTCRPIDGFLKALPGKHNLCFWCTYTCTYKYLHACVGLGEGLMESMWKVWLFIHNNHYIPET